MSVKGGSTERKNLRIEAHARDTSLSLQAAMCFAEDRREHCDARRRYGSGMVRGREARDRDRPNRDDTKREIAAREARMPRERMVDLLNSVAGSKVNG